eukprot:CAMPEP_0114593842 /NCGR_PEP_ID=MMETSP0125-20121206/15439_1 /TAXON_ID=485358 ORGANISM="Aristerostoma sp., Strain ATCC 50986" /NCGR_SAMPLE_ID=MMETSP0125 /ASSEMBLY_ACC=CAM_ASM_000245 /LENGTH=187 /DNA_ID=CAMNT_0001793431 /DNA_START=1693 /DNA_END=2256 /DNA_ORIENTATION=+
MKIDKVRVDDSPIVLIRARSILKGYSCMELFEQIYDSENRKKWDTVTTQLKILEQVDDKTDVIHFVIKTPFGCSNRDFVQKREYCLDYPKKDHIVVSFVSVTHPAMPHIKGNVRGDTKIAGYVMRPLPDDPNSTEMFILSQCDIKGMVPKFIVNYVAGKAPAEWIKKLTDACDVAKGLKKDKKKKKK